MDEYGNNHHNNENEYAEEYKHTDAFHDNGNTDNLKHAEQSNTDTAGTGSNYYGDMRTQEYMQAMAARAQQMSQGNAHYYGSGYGQSGQSQGGTNAYGYSQGQGGSNAYGYGYSQGQNGPGGYRTNTNYYQGSANGYQTAQNSDMTGGVPNGKKPPKVKVKKAKKEKAKKEKTRSGVGIWKRGIAIAASAVIFGGIAGGTFYGIAGNQIRKLNELSNQTTAAATETTAEQNTTESLSLTSTTSGSTGMDVSTIAENVMPSMVSVTISAIVEEQSMFGTQQYEAEGSGSGVIIGENDTELLIVTNNHVVSDATTVNVAFVDDESYEAKVKSTDSDTDLAILVVDLDDISDSTMSQIKIATIGDSDSIKVGEQVVAIGNALGYGQSVTTGIVSAKDRTTSTNTTPLIQTDAAINPGNSGGALLNMNGEVIGINSSKYSDTDVEGMGYAIPITEVQDRLDDLMSRETREKVDESERGYLGISCQSVSTEVSEAYGIPTGVLVVEVQSGSAAEEAGIKQNYVITAIDGQTIADADELTEKLSYYKSGETIPITYQYLQDDSYVEKTVDVTLMDNPNN